MLRIDAGQVDLIEAERDYMRLHVGARSWLIHQTIKSLEARMDPDRLIRIHRSKMVRRDGIAGLRSEAGRVGKECVSTCISRWPLKHIQEKYNKMTERSI